MPSCGEDDRPTGPQGPGLPEDVAAVRAALAQGDEPTVVVAHSYGGIVTAEAAVGVESVRHLVLVSSYLPEPGKSLSAFRPSCSPRPSCRTARRTSPATRRPFWSGRPWP
ncbi:alpha/beta fold hydrolase [Streptomyces canus]